MTLPQAIEIIKNCPDHLAASHPRSMISIGLVYAYSDGNNHDKIYSLQDVIVRNTGEVIKFKTPQLSLLDWMVTSDEWTISGQHEEIDMSKEDNDIKEK